MKAAFVVTLASALFSVAFTSAQAQTPIRDLQRQSDMTISGEIRRIVGNEFILDDGTGQIIVDAEDIAEYMGKRSLNLREGERITVTGEYDDYDFDAYTIQRSNGEVFRVRFYDD
ncbi:MAG: DNA-binding protein [Spirulinaceae cyanobacterium]